jgi:hypothetical protein
MIWKDAAVAYFQLLSRDVPRIIRRQRALNQHLNRRAAEKQANTWIGINKVYLTCYLYYKTEYFHVLEDLFLLYRLEYYQRSFLYQVAVNVHRLPKKAWNFLFNWTVIRCSRKTLVHSYLSVKESYKWHTKKQQAVVVLSVLLPNIQF